MPSNRSPEPWHSFFAEIDKSLKEQVALHCLGGFVMTILYGLDRPTADVDVLPIGANSETESLLTIAGEGSVLHKKYKVYLQVVGVATVPVNYEDRLKEMFPGTLKHLRLFALDPYDLALSKLERNTQRDRDDVKHLARKIPFSFNYLSCHDHPYRTEKRLFLLRELHRLQLEFQFNSPCA